VCEAKKLQLPIPTHLYEKIGNQETVINLIKKGLLSFRIHILEQEILSLTKQIEHLRKQVNELPEEVKRMETILNEMLKDNNVIETLLRPKKVRL
jgi:flagellar biosynthesis chaperone FliJ